RCGVCPGRGSVTDARRRTRRTEPVRAGTHDQRWLPRTVGKRARAYRDVPGGSSVGSVALVSLVPGSVPVDPQQPLRVGTHSGSFHADEVFALATLRIAHGPLEIVRSRDPEKLAACAMRID